LCSVSSSAACWQFNRLNSSRQPRPFVITPEMGSSFIEALAVERFHGVGPATAAKMKKLGIFSARDLWSVKLLGTTLIDLIWVAQASLASMAGISIQDDANVARHRPLFKLIEESALVNPIKKTYKRRGSRAVVRRPSLLGSLPSVEPGRGSLSVEG
jgi:hypothetical protein